MTVARRKKTARRTEFGDFQTPKSLAREICALLRARGLRPAALLEPTCGEGSFLAAGMSAFPELRKALGVEINPAYVATARGLVHDGLRARSIAVLEQDFFDTDWTNLLAELPDPLLVLGNPPWVTNSGLGGVGGGNLPHKTNFHGRRGIEAITGKSNFDISEWMLLRLMEWCHQRSAWLAMLCKTVVARKVLQHGWATGKSIARAELRRIDAQRYFGAAVDACLLLVEFGSRETSPKCPDFPSLRCQEPTRVYGHRDGRLVADMASYDRWRHLQGNGAGQWRSGIKHDCAKVFELRPYGRRFRNGLGQIVDLEPTCLYPMLKSSDLAGERDLRPSRWMLVTQKTVGEESEPLQRLAPKTWEYLQRNARLLDRRASAIYKRRPRFSIFGVGPYSFSPWKVAVSGLYKSLRFRGVGPFEGRPIVFDDTCCFYSCQKEADAKELAEMLNSKPAQEFFASFIFWDAKRPITIEVLQRLDLANLAGELGASSTLRRQLEESQARKATHAVNGGSQRLLF